MITNSINGIEFTARIKIYKPKLEAKIYKSAGISSLSGASSSLTAGSSSGADMVVHSSGSAVPAIQQASSLFDQFADYGHKIFNTFQKEYTHNGYDAAFFSMSSSSGGAGAYYYGMNTLVKGIEKEYKNKKIPTL